MSNEARPRSIAEMPAQRPAHPASPAEARGRFFNTGNGFNVKLPPVPDRTFTEEPRAALDPATPTGLIACDISAELNCAFPATTPLVLAHYAKIRAGETLAPELVASGVIAYVIQGSGTTRCGQETIVWDRGDLFILPGGVQAAHQASEAADAVLWVVTNEPQLAFEALRPPAPGRAPTDVVHYRAAEIERQIDLIYDIGRGEEIAGSALIFSAERQEATRNILPTLTVAMNSLPGGAVQRPHRHNSIAVSLIIKGDRCFSIIDGRRKDWAPYATTITPPESVHSHHNGGNEQALFLIVQDGGLYYHARAMGFAFAEHPQWGETMSASTNATTRTRLTVRPLHPALGAEVRGIDMRAPLDADTFRELHDVWMRHLVLVFPEQRISDAEHVAFTRHFGEPEIFHQKIIRSKRVPEIFRVSNVDDEGNLMPPDHPTVKQVALAQFWHTDSSYRSIPCVGALLHGVEVSRTGGETQFTNLYQVYEELPEALKRRIAGRRARHDFGHLHTLSQLKPLTEEEKAAMPPVWQPMVRKHPVTGRPSLYISPIYNDEIEGLDKGEARQLLDELPAFAAQPRFVYRHRWEPDDVVMWDNRCTMHQVTPFDPRERRVMHRTTIVGTEPVIAA